MNPQEATKMQVIKLIQEKERIEKEIEINGADLMKNNVGFNEPLVDENGFPRNDIDVRMVRLARNKIICLQNDLKIVLQAIEEGLAKYFAENKDTPMDVATYASHNRSSTDSTSMAPFLRVNLVSENSPGHTAGVLVNDLITSFGSINSKNFKDLNQIGGLVKNCVNQPIKMKIVRNGTPNEITLVPKEWNGQGLLGFKIAPIPTLL